MKSKKHFAIISGCIAHNEFWQSMIDKANLSHNYVSISHAPEITPAQIRQEANLIEKLLPIAEYEILNNEVDTFTLGCGSFIGVAKPLETALQQKFGSSISVVDPVAAAFAKM